MKVKAISKQWRFPEASERQLSRSLAEAVDKIADRAKGSVKRLKFDVSDAEINQEEDDITSEVLSVIAIILATLAPIGLLIYRFNTAQFIAVAMAAPGGKDNEYVQSVKAFGAIGVEPWNKEVLTQWESLATASVRKVFDSIISDWSTSIRDASLRGMSEDQVTVLIDKRVNVWKSWAANRARLITGTLNSVLMRHRLDDAGVDSYFWRGMLDERERLQHLKWEMKLIKITDDHPFPGEPYGCRCWAQPNFNKENGNDEQS